jgi:DNA-binding protein H-NS
MLRTIGQQLATECDILICKCPWRKHRGENMVTNLNTAKSLIQADLDHARNVLKLWTQQVAELEKALEQIEAVGSSRNALRVEYQAGAARGPAPDSSSAGDAKPKRGRKPKNPEGSPSTPSRASATTLTAKRGRKFADRVTVAPEQVSEAPARKTRKVAGAKKDRAKPAPKYKDPNSDKTWSGLGRRPAWFSGDAEQYSIRAQEENAGGESQSNVETS